MSTIRSMTLRLPHDLWVQLCQHARAESQLTGETVSVAQVVRRAIRKEVAK